MSETGRYLDFKEWDDHYNKRTEIAQWANTHVRQTYKGMSYIPWAIMAVVLKHIDPTYHVEKVVNDNGTFVFDQVTKLSSTKRTVEPPKSLSLNELKTWAKEGIDRPALHEQVTETHVSNDFHTFFIKVRITMFGVVHEEFYPVLDNSYAPVTTPKTTDVNNAFQRAFARLASQITGVGFSLYTNEEILFDENAVEEVAIPKAPTPTPTPTPTPKVAKAPKATKTVAVEEPSIGLVIKENYESSEMIRTLVARVNTLLSKVDKAPLDLSLDADTLTNYINENAHPSFPKAVFDALKKEST